MSFSLNINSTYNSNKYEDLMKPILLYKATQDQYEKEYDTYASDAEKLKRSIDMLDDSSENKIAYSDYMNSLDNAASQMGKGLSPQVRKNMRDLRRRYYSTIEPMKEANARIKEIADEQRKLAAAHPDMMFDTDFSNEVTLDAMMANPNLSYKTVSGNDIATKSAAITKAMASRIRSIDPALGGQYWAIKEGIGEEAANRFLMTNMESMPELKSALEGILTSSGVTEKNWNRALEYAKTGAASAMIQDIKYQANRAYQEPEKPGSLTERQRLGIDPLEKNGNRYYNQTTGAVETRNSAGEVISSFQANAGKTVRTTNNKEIEVYPSDTYPGYQEDKNGYIYKEIEVDGKTIHKKLNKQELKDLDRANNPMVKGFVMSAESWSNTPNKIHNLTVGTTGEANTRDLRIVYENGKTVQRGHGIDIKESAIDQIKQELNNYNSKNKTNIDINDIVIYADYDAMSNNHYIITTKYNDTFTDKEPSVLQAYRNGRETAENLKVEKQAQEEVNNLVETNASSDTIINETVDSLQTLIDAGNITEEEAMEQLDTIKEGLSNPEDSISKEEVLEQLRKIKQAAIKSALDNSGTVVTGQSISSAGMD